MTVFNLRCNFPPVLDIYWQFIPVELNSNPDVIRQNPTIVQTTHQTATPDINQVLHFEQITLLSYAQETVKLIN